MTITEIYNTAESTKEQLTTLARLANELATKLDQANETPSEWNTALHEMAKEIIGLRKRAEDWKIEHMTKKLVEAMAKGDVTEEMLLEYDRR